jgi:hypothetical protein
MVSDEHVQEFLNKIVESVEALESNKESRLDQRAFDSFATIAMTQLMTGVTMAAMQKGEPLSIPFDDVARAAWKMAGAMMMHRERQTRDTYAAIEAAYGEESPQAFTPVPGPKAQS